MKMKKKIQIIGAFLVVFIGALAVYSTIAKISGKPNKLLSIIMREYYAEETYENDLGIAAKSGVSVDTVGKWLALNYISGNLTFGTNTKYPLYSAEIYDEGSSDSDSLTFKTNGALVLKQVRSANRLRELDSQLLAKGGHPILYPIDMNPTAPFTPTSRPLLITDAYGQIVKWDMQKGFSANNPFILSSPQGPIPSANGIKSIVYRSINTADHYLVTYSSTSQVILFNATGAIIWSSDNVPGLSLVAPVYADCIDDTTFLITDKVGKVYEVNRKKNTFTVPSGLSSLSKPVRANRLPNGNTLVVEQDNKRVIEVNPAGNVTVVYAGSDLLYPVYAYRVTRNNQPFTIIVDGLVTATKTPGDVMEVGSSQNIIWSTAVGDSVKLYNPISVLPLPGDMRLVLDGGREAENKEGGIWELGYPKQGYFETEILPFATENSKKFLSLTWYGQTDANTTLTFKYLIGTSAWITLGTTSGARTSGTYTIVPPVNTGTRMAIGITLKRIPNEPFYTPRLDRIRIDYQEVTPSGWAISKVIKPDSLQSWGWLVFHSIGDTPSVIVSVRDGGNDTLIASARVPEYPVRISTKAESIKVRADISTTTIEVLPKLLDWKVFWTTTASAPSNIRFVDQLGGDITLYKVYGGKSAPQNFVIVELHDDNMSKMADAGLTEAQTVKATLKSLGSQDTEEITLYYQSATKRYRSINIPLTKIREASNDGKLYTDAVPNNRDTLTVRYSDPFYPQDTCSDTVFVEEGRIGKVYFIKSDTKLDSVTTQPINVCSTTGTERVYIKVTERDQLYADSLLVRLEDRTSYDIERVWVKNTGIIDADTNAIFVNYGGLPIFNVNINYKGTKLDTSQYKVGRLEVSGNNLHVEYYDGGALEGQWDRALDYLKCIEVPTEKSGKLTGPITLFVRVDKQHGAKVADIGYCILADEGRDIKVNLRIFNIAGDLVRTMQGDDLPKNDACPIKDPAISGYCGSGNTYVWGHKIWDLTNDAFVSVASGVYIVIGEAVVDGRVTGSDSAKFVVVK